MKLINKFLIICSFCLLFVINVNATEMSSKYSVPSYTSEQIEQINSFKNSSKYSQIIDYIQNNLNNYFDASTQSYYDFTDNYFMLIQFSQFNSDSIIISFMKNLDNIPYNVYYSNYSDYGGYYLYTNASSGLGLYYKFDFTNDELTNASYYSKGNDAVYFTNILDESNENFISYPGKYIDTTFFDSTNQTVSFGYDEGRFTVNVPIKLNDTIYTPPSSFNGQDFINNLNNSLSPEPYQDFGTYENVNVVTYKILDDEPGHDKEVTLTLDINSLNVSDSIFNIYKYGSTIYTSYDSFSCNNGNNNNSVCSLVITYDVSDSVSDKLMFDIVLDDVYDLSVSDTSVNNKVFINRQNIEYEFRSINFKEMSALVFYPYNYNLFSSIYNSNSDNFKFLFTNIEANSFLYNSNTYRRSTTYDQDFKYQNTYIYFDSSSSLVYAPKDNYVILNNLSYLMIPFSYDSSILSNSHYPCFLISNPNYLGSIDINNKDVYVYYNSSLFNFKSTFHVYFNGEDDTSFFHFEGLDINFIDENNDYVSYPIDETVFYDSGYEDTIINKYNNLLEFFKDKIISFFELVSHFFNTMPVKFQYGFSLIFILFVAIYLFRLLL